MPKLWIGNKMYSVEGEVRDYCEKLEEQLEQHRWIPVSERLPEKEQLNSVMSNEVFVSDGREVWKARCVVSGKRWSYTNSPSATLPITHWMPIFLP